MTFDPTTQSYIEVPKNNPKDRVQVEIGDTKDPTTFHPQVKIMRWDNEVNASLRLKHDLIVGGMFPGLS